MLRELEYVIAVVENGSVSKAAESLFISQPSLSRYLKDLEDNIGVQLFRRVHNRLVLTYAGERYVAVGKNILRLYNELETELQNINEAVTGRLRIGIASLRMSYIMPGILKNYITKYPLVEVQMFENPTKELEEMLISDKIDIAIINGNECNAQITYQPFFTEEILLAVPYNHPLAQKGASKDSCQYPWMDLRLTQYQPFIILSDHQRLYDISMQIFEKYNIHPKTALCTKSAESAFRLVEAGIGLTFVPETFTRFSLTDKPPALFSIGEPCIQWKLCAAWKTEGLLTPTAKKLIQIIKNMYL
ncbi:MULTISPECIES: LysR family transcriptional regulator [Acutalibacteraceae]|uniref:LysR family transcriptional regulator n=1 Tax=Acutalibacteraceae TaxID=3082771 RepID=UPI0013E8DDF0|nr:MULTISPECIES: LysR family transcriptional regulator [Acutalibacteraceae]